MTEGKPNNCCVCVANFPFNIDIVQKTNTESPVELINIPYRHPLIIIPFFHYASKTDIIMVR